MRVLKSVCILSLGSFAIVACSSKGGAGSGNQGPQYDPNASGNNVTGGLVAQDTANGLTPISAATADSLANSTDNCTGWSVEPEGGAPPVFEFVMDASGSMNTDPANPADPNGPNKWTVFSQTMPGVFASLPANFAVGVTYYNKPDGDTNCYRGRQAVAIAPLGAAGSTQRTQIDRSIANTTPQNYTPTYNAWSFGLQTLNAWQAPAAYATSPRYIVLITDGVPTVKQDGCTIQNPISQQEYNSQLALIQSAEGNVKTFVVGVVGSENPQKATYDPLYMLSEFAVTANTATPAGCVPKSGTPAGNTVDPRGTYCHYDLSQATDFGAALSSTLGGIANSVISCDYTIPTPPNNQTIDTSRTVLVYNDGSGNYSLVLPNTSGTPAATCDKGYVYADAAKTSVHICASTCTALQQNPNATLQLRFVCGTGTIVN